MARWRLAAPHYLNVPDTFWEYKEVDRTTGKQKRVQFPVPALLDPSQPGDWNYRHNADEGEIIVCQPGKGLPKDIEFEGEPTPDMVPMDDEAQVISASFAKKWKHPIESLPGTYADSLLNTLQEEVAEVRAKGASAQVEGMTELLTAMTAMMKQNQDILAALVASKVPAASANGAVRK